MCLRGTKSGLVGSASGERVKVVEGSSDPLLSNRTCIIDSVRAGRLLLAGGGGLVILILRGDVAEGGVDALE